MHSRVFMTMPTNIIQLNINTEKTTKSYISTCEPFILAPT